eukprot:COSAG05_NODE_93_length_19581_cov_53.686685_19_plen_92_part_00
MYVQLYNRLQLDMYRYIEQRILQCNSRTIHMCARHRITTGMYESHRIARRRLHAGARGCARGRRHPHMHASGSCWRAGGVAGRAPGQTRCK